jgi:hypothetical protein
MTRVMGKQSLSQLRAIGCVIPLLAPLCGAQSAGSPATPRREIWVDAIHGNDINGTGQRSQPYRTVSRVLHETSVANQMFGSLIFVDLDLDGDRDLLRQRGLQAIRYYRSDGIVSWPEYAYVGEIAPVGYENSLLLPADVDGDGDQDLVHVGRTPLSGVVLCSENLGGFPSTFAPPQQVLDLSGAPVRLLSSQFGIGDVDGDGVLDFVAFIEDYGPGGCSGVLFNRAFLLQGQRVGGTLRFAAPTPIATSAGGVAFPSCGPGSCILDDLDADGAADLIFATDHELYWCRKLSGTNFAPPVLLAPRHAANAVDVKQVFERGFRGERYLLLAERKETFAPSLENPREHYARRIFVQSSPTPSVQLGDPVPFRLQGHLDGEMPEVMIRLLPGTYSAASGETFPWNGLYGVHIEGGPGVVVDAGNEILLVSTDIETAQRVITVTPPNLPRPTWGTGRIHLENLSFRTSQDHVYLRWYGELHARNVRFEGGGAGVLLGVRNWSYGTPVAHAVFEGCHFEGCNIGIEVGTATNYEQVDIRHCSFERCGTAISVLDRGRWTIERSRFVGNQRAFAARTWRTCTATPCPTAEALQLLFTGNHFADNTEHLSLLSQSATFSNLDFLSWHDTIVGGGIALRSPASGNEPARVSFRHGILYPGGPLTSGNFGALEIAASSVDDAVLSTLNGNRRVAPEFALSPSEGHLVARSALRDVATLSIPASARRDQDGDPRPLGPRADLGADEVRTPALIGAAYARRGQPWTLGLVAEGPGAALVMLSTELAAPQPFLGDLLWLDPSRATTLLLPLAIDARGVGSLSLLAPSRAQLPVEQLWFQALVLEASSATRLTPRRGLGLR